MARRQARKDCVLAEIYEARVDNKDLRPLHPIPFRAIDEFVSIIGMDTSNGGLSLSVTPLIPNEVHPVDNESFISSGPLCTKVPRSHLCWRPLARGCSPSTFSLAQLEL